MPENQSTIALQIGAQRFEGWESVSMEFDMESLVSTFSLGLYDPDRLLSVDADDFPAGQACKISITNKTIPISYISQGGTGFQTSETVIDGFIVRRRRALSRSSNVLTVEGADKLVDLVDCSAEHTSRTWMKKPFSGIVRDLVAPFDITVNSLALQGDPLIDKFTLQSGETVFDAIERLCRSQAVLPLSDFKGNVVLSYAATKAEPAAAWLMLGVNLLSLEENVDWSERYSKYTVLGQSAGDGKKWTTEMLQSSATARDTGITRYRPKIIISENRATNEIMIKRVRWEAQVKSGRSTEYTATVRGWYKTNLSGQPDSLWQKNEKLILRCTPWGIYSQELLITKVVFSLDDSGELTQLTLKHPDVFKAQPGAVVDLS